MRNPSKTHRETTIREGSIFYFTEESFKTDKPHYFVTLNHTPLKDGVLKSITLFDCNNVFEKDIEILIDKLSKKELKTHGCIESDILERLRRGVIKSPQVTRKIKKILKANVLPKKGQVAIFNIDEIALIPYTTVQLYLLGIDYFHEAIIKAESSETVARTVRDIELTLRESHNITNAEDDDFFVTTQEDIVEQVQTITGAFTAFLSSVVAIALVVGGIGVMNIMLVSATERTREIGLRKALGATGKDIITQFLLEAVSLTALGGIIGIILGGVFSFVASLILTNVLDLNWEFTFPISAAVLGLGMSAFAGLVFGIYPARQASLKSPMEALRYE